MAITDEIGFSSRPARMDIGRIHLRELPPWKSNHFFQSKSNNLSRIGIWPMNSKAGEKKTQALTFAHGRVPRTFYNGFIAFLLSWLLQSIRFSSR
jgi:hypothetical protein